VKLDFEKIMKKQLEQIVNNEINKLIHDEVDKFYRELSFKKDEYIAELMKSIRIYSEQESIDYIPRYKIIIENTYKIEK
jgi:hypothetical protein